MRRLLAGIRKEFQILIRDIYGLLLLFLMPVLLLIVLTLAQEKAIGVSGKDRTGILLVSHSQSSFPDSLEKALDQSGFFRVIRTTEGKSLTESQALEMIREGNYPLAVTISAGDSAIRILVDPTLEAPYRESLVSSLTWLIKSLQAKMITEQYLSGLLPGSSLIFHKNMQKSLEKMPSLEKKYVTRDIATLKPTIIQNNIPGFILFAMFFIVIPLSGSLIAEKQEGSFLRLKSLPVSASLILAPKIIIYLIVCLIQFCLMMAAGIWLFPGLFGLPPIQPGHQYVAIVFTTIVSALGAIGFGLLMGVLSKTHSQSALFGSVLVVILGIISGTFFPMYLLPESMKVLGSASPVSWGVNNYIALFVRGASLADILPNIFLILAFFVFAMTISIFIFAKQK